MNENNSISFSALSLPTVYDSVPSNVENTVFYESYTENYFSSAHWNNP